MCRSAPHSQRNLRLLLFGAALIVTAAVGGFTALREPPLPAPDEVRARMREAWRGALPYDVRVGVRVPQSRMHSEAFLHCAADGSRLLAASNMAGFRRVERFPGPDRWEYFQYGLDTLFDVRFRTGANAPFLRWRLSGFPSPEDILRGLFAAQGLEVRRRFRSKDGALLEVRCDAPHPEFERLDHADQFRFERDALGRPWQLAISERTWLPVRMMVGGPEAPAHYEAGWTPMSKQDMGRRARWIDDGTSAAYRRTPQKTVRLHVRDARSTGDLDRAKNRIVQDVDAWMRKFYR